ncbi:MAG: hypothetical protein E7412_07600 [Ruminococcaceae bacterium]|nr:hypothetical protein [Oscillospiraceae bacterium]
MESIVKKLYGEENSLSLKNFKTPSSLYSPVYNWIWNGPITREEIDNQLDEMQRLGIKAIAIIAEPKTFRPASVPTLLEPDYLTKPYFEEYRYAAECIKKRGMYMWFYDEGGWPSGGACGKVMNEHPEFGRQSLASRKAEFSKGDVYTAANDTILALLDDDTQIENGYVFESDCKITEYYYFKNRFEPGIPELPDVTRAEATDKFIEYTHEAYKPYLKELFGDILLAVFTDEPTAPRKVPFREEIEELFEKENGYSIHKFLPELLGERTPTIDGSRARIAWFDLCSRLFCDNFLLKNKKWSNKNGMAFTGHMDIDHTAYRNCIDSGNFNLLRALRCFDIPGIDVIWRQIFPEIKENPAEKSEALNNFFPRYASSAAAQVGERYSMSESLGVYGEGVDFNQMRYVLNYQVVRGINLFNIFAVPYYRRGFLMMGELPFFTEKHACYSDLAVFNEYAERMSYLASLGERTADIALYMPVCDLMSGKDTEQIAEAFEAIAKQMENERLLFDIADDDVFALADSKLVDSGKIVMGKTNYTAVVVPECRFMPEKTKEVLRRFSLGGGKVFVVSNDTLAGLEDAILIDDIKGTFTSPLSISGETDLVRLGVRACDNGTLYMLFNEADAPRTFDVSIIDNIFVLDAENGKIFEPNSLTFTLPSGKILFLWQGDADNAEKEDTLDREITLQDFTFRRTKRFVIGVMDFENQLIDEAEIPVKLGDWCEYTGKEFSGSGIYKTRFSLPEKVSKIRLDLGKVCCSCEVFVNGKSVGIKAMTPYSIEISGDLLKEDNLLEIRVSNTGANEYLYTKSFDKWQDWQLTPFRDRENVFHADSLAGGLYGPVKILY